MYQISANAKKRERYLKNTWKEAWGTASKKEYDRTKYESISHYFQQQLRKGKITEPYVDDITWNDLDLDEVYQVMDHTILGGAEYLRVLSSADSGAFGREIEGTRSPDGVFHQK